LRLGPERPELRRQRILLEAALAVWRSRIARLLSVLVLVVIVGSAIWLSSLYAGALSPECETWPRIEMPIEEVIALKRRLEAYQQDEDPSATLVLTGDEVTALLREEMDYGIRLVLLGDRIEATVVVPAEGGCYNVHYTGRLRVEERVAKLEPEVLTVGTTDLSDWMRGGLYEVDAEMLEDRVDPYVIRALENTERIEVVDGQMRLRLYDRYQMPW
jgi:hypothetical protein